MKTFLKPLLAVFACAAVLAGCDVFQHGESADPPAGGITAVPGDGQVTISWVPDAGVEYWLFWGLGSTVDVTHPTAIRTNVASPFTVTGLVNGSTYAFTINGRKDGGPGGSPAPVVTAIPRPDGLVWNIGGTAGTNDLKSVAYGGAYDAVGNSGALFTSTDGITWTAAAGNWAALAGSTNVNAIIDVFSRFIVVGDAGLILYTTDNITWTPGAFAVTPPAAPKLNALATDSSARVVAVGDAGAIYYSDDSGATWKAAASVPAGTGNLYGAAFSTVGRWVAVGAAGTILTSSDGSTWTPATSVTPAITTDLTSVTFQSFFAFVAVGRGGEVAASGDGLVWTTQSITTVDLQSVAGSVSGTPIVVAVGNTGTIFSSSDGITWVNRASGTTSNLLGVLNGGGQFVAVGQAGITLNSK